MPEIELAPLVALGFGMGLLHATDTDHVVAVTGLAARGTSGFANSVVHCTKWALGHALVLMLVGIGVFGLGQAIPTTLATWAENLVGVMLQIVGLWVFWDLYRTRLHCHPHSHGDTAHHVHWHLHGSEKTIHTDKPLTDRNHTHSHGAVLVGMVHGLAGSAPLFLLIPIANSTSILEGMAYLLLFSIGVLLGMLGVGVVIGSVMTLAARKGTMVIRRVRELAGIVSVGYGTYLILH